MNIEDVRSHLQSLPPHVVGRKTHQLLTQMVVEVERLREEGPVNIPEPYCCGGYLERLAYSAGYAKCQAEVKQLRDEQTKCIHAAIMGTEGRKQFEFVPEMTAAMTADHRDELQVEVEGLRKQLADAEHDVDVLGKHHNEHHEQPTRCEYDKSEDGRTLRGIANTTWPPGRGTRVLHAIADRLDQREAVVERLLEKNKNYIESLRSIASMKVEEGDRMQLWATDSLSGYTATSEDTLAEVQVKVEGLQAIVDKLPKTADGVSVMPGACLYAAHHAGQMVTAKRVAVFADPGLYSHWYSTAEAAKAALAAHKP